MKKFSYKYDQNKNLLEILKKETPILTFKVNPKIRKKLFIDIIEKLKPASTVREAVKQISENQLLCKRLTDHQQCKEISKIFFEKVNNKESTLTKKVSEIISETLSEFLSQTGDCVIEFNSQNLDLRFRENFDYDYYAKSCPWAKKPLMSF